MPFLYSAISNAQGLFKALYIQGSDGHATHGATHFLDIIGNMQLSIFPKDTTGAAGNRTHDPWIRSPNTLTTGLRRLEHIEKAIYLVQG